MPFINIPLFFETSNVNLRFPDECFSFKGCHAIIDTMKIRWKKWRILSFLPMMLMMYLIFSFSSQTGEESGNLSYEISYRIMEVKNDILNEGKTEAELAVSADAIHYYVRKAAHMTEYFILSWTIAFPLFIYGMRGKRLFFTTLLCSVLTAASDEYHQSFVGGRGPSVKDVGIDSIGAFAGTVITIFLAKLYLKKGEFYAQFNKKSGSDS